jgi:cytochrome c2
MKQVKSIAIFFILAVPVILFAKDDLISMGKQIFEKDCLKCHPYEGGGSGSSVDLSTYTFDKLKKSKFCLVTKKSDKDIEALAAYLSTLQKN